MDPIQEIEEVNLNAVPKPKVKRPMNEKERERNERRKAALEELRKINPKAKWTNASKLVSQRNKGNNEGARNFLNTMKNSKTTKYKPKNITKNNTKNTSYKKRKAQVNENVARNGIKLNAIQRKKLATLRRNNPALSVANFKKNLPARTRKIGSTIKPQQPQQPQQQQQPRILPNNEQEKLYKEYLNNQLKPVNEGPVTPL